MIKSLYRIPLYLIIFITPIVAASAQRKKIDQSVQKIKKVAEELRQKAEVPGMAFGIVKDGKVIKVSKNGDGIPDPDYDNNPGWIWNDAFRKKFWDHVSAVDENGKVTINADRLCARQQAMIFV